MEDFSAKDILNLLLELRNDAIDEIPDDIVRGRNNGMIYKCQRTWFDGVIIIIGNIDEILRAVGVDLPLEVKMFAMYSSSDYFHAQLRTTRQDIAFANKVLDQLIFLICNVFNLTLQEQSFIKCQNYAGGTIDVPTALILERVSSYGFILPPSLDERLLLVKLGNGNYFLPGGAKEPWETNAEAVVRETVEETGIEIAVHSRAGFGENFFYYPPLNEAYHATALFFLAVARHVNMVDPENIHDEEVVDSKWVRFLDMRPEMWQVPKVWGLLVKFMKDFRAGKFDGVLKRRS